jgi:hypothetical protein
MTLQELFTDESRWTKDAFARNAKGKARGPLEPDAVRWCLMGALDFCYGPKSRQQATLRRKIETSPSYHTGIAQFNDSTETTFADIRKVIEEANV